MELFNMCQECPPVKIEKGKRRRKPVPLEKSLAFKFPNLVKEWDYDKNGDITPYDVTAGSNKKYHWLCPVCNHSWQATVNNRTSGRNCPACSGKAVTPQNCLAATHPKTAAQWHPTKNGDITPYDVTAGSNKKYHWLCPVCNHSWQATVNNRTNGKGCPSCVGQVVTPQNCLAATHPKTAAQWHPTKNGDITPYDVTAGSEKKPHWLCEICGHSWQAIVSSRTRGNGCPGCAGRYRNCLATTHPKIAAQWDYDKNGDITPYDVTAGSTKKYHWFCEICGHSWQATIGNRTRGNGCPGCAGQVVTPQNCLAKIHPKIAAQWDDDKNGDITPYDVTAGSTKKPHWLCEICGHSWQDTICHRTNGRNCPACSGKVVTPQNCLAKIHPKIAAQWDDDKNGDITPYDVTAGSRYRAYWLCEICGHSWQARVCNRTNGNNCPTCCESKGEKSIASWLSLNNINYIREFTFEDCKDKGKLRFDFEFKLNNKQFLIEYQGRQHYQAIDYFGGDNRLKETQKRDKIKKNYCKKNKIPLLVIPYTIKNIEEQVMKFIKKHTKD